MPLLHVCGAADTVVPVSVNTAVVEKRYKALGGSIKVILKDGVGHHPHSLKDPKPIVDFILKHTKGAAAEARARGPTKSTVRDGPPELTDAGRAKIRRDYGVDYARDEVTVSAGAKQVLFNALLASLDAGDEVIVPAPYWTSYNNTVSYTHLTLPTNREV